MATGFRLLDQPNPNYKQYRVDRRMYLPSGNPAHGGVPTGAIILHDAEGGTDLVGADMGAEKVAQFLCTRNTPGSYHTLTDRDSIIRMAPYLYETWHDTTSNPYTVGISVAWNKADLPHMTYAQRVEFYRLFARAVLDAVAWFKTRGIIVPIDRFLSRAEVMAGKPGLSTHSRMDPSRRSDPFGTGSVYEAEFLAILAEEAGKTNNTQKEDDDVALTEKQARALDWLDDRRAGLDILRSQTDDIWVHRQRWIDTLAEVKVLRRTVEALAESLSLPADDILALIEQRIKDITITVDVEPKAPADGA